MAHAEYHKIWPIGKDTLFSVITDYASYPRFVDGCKSTRVEPGNDDQVRVEYHVEVMSQDVTYVLDHHQSLETGDIEWTLISSNFFKTNNGRWKLKPIGEDKTEVSYIVDIEFKIPVPGFILNRLVKSGLPTMVESFQKKAANFKSE